MAFTTGFFESDAAQGAGGKVLQELENLSRSVEQVTRNKSTHPNVEASEILRAAPEKIEQIMKDTSQKPAPDAGTHRP